MGEEGCATGEEGRRWGGPWGCVPSGIRSWSFLVEVVADLTFVIKGDHGAGRDRLEEAAAAFFFFMGDVAASSSSSGAAVCRPLRLLLQQNNFPLILTPPESLIL
jgi:hypothetical protein